jgi:putative PIN family toxin of toxin-antitoxin system
MRVVLDANVLVSGLISAKGSPAKMLDLWREEMFDVVVSPPILRELERVLHYPRLQQCYDLPGEKIQGFLDRLSRLAIEVDPSEEVTLIESDPADNRYLECALAGGARFVVSGDTHLLEVGEFRGIQILTPAGFLAFLQLEG